MYMKHTKHINLTWETLLKQHVYHMQHMKPNNVT
jgi:hypothetical protein